MRIEHPRKHGPFDRRYPSIRDKPAPDSLWRLGEERLDWQGFLARFFSGSRRHDFDALAAYESYVNDTEDRPGGGAPGPALAGSPSAAHAARSHTTQRSENEQERLVTADIERWEGEGGASAARVARKKRGERPAGIHGV